MTANWSTVIVLFFLQEIIIAAASESCLAPSDTLHPSKCSGKIVYNVSGSNDCTWVLSCSSCKQCALVLNLTHASIVAGRLYLPENLQVAGDTKYCVIYKPKNLECKSEHGCQTHAVETLPSDITYKVSTDRRNSFTVAYNFTHCGAGTTREKSTTESTFVKSAKLPDKGSPSPRNETATKGSTAPSTASTNPPHEDNVNPPSPSPGTSGANSADNMHYFIIIAVLAILLLVAVAVVLVMSQRMRKMKSVQVGAIVQASRNEQGLRIGTQNAVEGHVADVIQNPEESSSKNASEAGLHGRDTSEQQEAVAESTAGASSCVYAVVQKKRSAEVRNH